MKQGTDPEGSIKIIKQLLAEKEAQISKLRKEIKELHKDIHIIECGYQEGEGHGYFKLPEDEL